MDSVQSSKIEEIHMNLYMFRSDCTNSSRLDNQLRICYNTIRYPHLQSQKYIRLRTKYELHFLTLRCNLVSIEYINLGFLVERLNKDHK